MFHPSILATYCYLRTDVGQNAIDSCTDAAQLHSIQQHTLARFLITMGIDAERLSLLA